MSITITPQSTVTLCKTKLENDYKNTLNFSNLAAQTSYFNGLTDQLDVTENDYTYIRKDNVITVGYPYDQLIGYNYLYYTNTGFTNKRYYCFINKIEYVSENSTKLYIETDVIQTYMFNLTYNQCYVEREHVADDSIGANTVPELLETGEYIINGTDYIMYDTSANVCISVSSTVNTGLYHAGTTMYNNVFSGEFLYTFDNPEQARNFLDIFDQAGQGEAINSVYMIPGTLFNKLSKISHTDTSYGITCTYYVVMGTSGNFIEQQKTVAMNTSLNGYTPKNKKLLCYPYNYLEIDNNNGASAVYHFEQFVNHAPSFQVAGAITPGCSIMCYPLNYNLKTDDHILSTGMLYSYNDGIPGGKYPVGSWRSDIYTNWLTQTCANRSFGLIKDSISAIGSAAMGNPAGAMNSVSNIFGTAVEVYQHSLTPYQTKGNTNCGDVTFAIRQTMFAIKNKCIKQEYARIIDGFFNLFGYKVNRLKVPQFTSRTNWNYVKTIDSNMEGDIPQEDLQKIRSIFDNGVTFWHNPATMLDYTQNNTIVS